MSKSCRHYGSAATYAPYNRCLKYRNVAALLLVHCWVRRITASGRSYRFYRVSRVSSVGVFFSGRSNGNKITSRMVGETVKSMHSRSTPTPTPPPAGTPGPEKRLDG